MVLFFFWIPCFFFQVIATLTLCASMPGRNTLSQYASTLILLRTLGQTLLNACLKTGLLFDVP